MTRVPFVALACLVLSCASEPRHRSSLREAKFGIFFGGQVQERKEIPLERDIKRQKQGFRLMLPHPEVSQQSVRWELDLPSRHGKRSRSSKSSEQRLTRLGQAVIRPGATRLDQRIDFHPGDRPGKWRIQVWLGQEQVLDRSFEVYDRRRRRRAEQADAGWP